MKIERLIIENINSLAGKWEIDFEDSAFQESGIFAITGDTGSGKSTILDCICLALYGLTPRLKGKQTTELMSVGQKGCRAELFFSLSGQRYRSWWSRRKNRRGKLEAEADMGLEEVRADGSLGQSLASKLLCVRQANEELLGLKFEQFTQAILLAQGRFLQFFSSTSEERVRLLSKITNTEYYKDLAGKVYEARKGAEEELNKAQELCGHVHLLEAGEVEAKERELAHSKERLALVQEFLAGVERDWGLQLQIHKAKEEWRKAQGEWQTLAKAWESFQPQKRQLERALELHQLGHIYLALQEQQQELHSLRQAIAESERGVELGQKGAAESQAQASQWSELLTTYRQLWQSAQPHLERLEEGERQLAVTRSKVEENRQLYRRKNALLEDLRRAYAERQRTWEGWRERLESSWNPQLERGERLWSQGQRLVAACAAEGHKRQLEAERWRERQVELEERLLRIWGRGGEELILERQRQLGEWQRQLERLLQNLEEEERLAKLQGELAENARSKDLERQYVESKLEVERQRLAQLDSKLGELEKSLERERAVVALEVYRSQLAEGQPCPLCGALDHPLRAEYSQQGDSHLAALQAERQALEAQRQEAQGQERELASHLAVVGRELQLVAEELERLAKERAARASQSLWPDSGALEEWDENLVQEWSRLVASSQRPQIESLPALRHLVDVVGEKLEILAQCYLEGRQVERQLYESREAEGQRQGEFQALEAQKGRLEDHLANLPQRLEGLRASLGEEGERLPQWPAEVAPTVGEERGPFKLALERALEAWDSFWREWPLWEAALRDLQLQRDQLQRDLESERRLIEEAQKELQSLTERGLEGAKALVAESEGLRRLEEEWRLMDWPSLWRERWPEVGQGGGAGYRKAWELGWAQAEERARLLQGEAQRAERHLHELLLNLERQRSQYAQIQQSQIQLSSQWRDALRNLELENEEAYLRERWPVERLEALQEQSQLLSERLQRAQDWQARAQSQYEKLEQERPQRSLEELEAAKGEGQREREELWQRLGALELELKRQRENVQRLQELLPLLEEKQAQYRRWDRLALLFGNREGKNFNNYVQSLTFKLLVARANLQLRQLSDRYELTIKASNLTLKKGSEEEEGLNLDFNVFDNYQSIVRSSKNLSGGESFLVSLAMALALSEIASQRCPLDSLFLDEGFGTLDVETLDTVLGALSSLQGRHKLVGVVSHVSELKERIPVHLELVKNSQGRSTLRGPGVRLLAKG